MIKTPKKLLSTLEQEEKLLEFQNLYYQQPKPEYIPDRLYHFIKEEDPALITEALNKIKDKGLKNAKNPRSTTRVIDKAVQRPLGIYFWGECIKEEAHIEVKVNNLNFNNLYAFPHSIADSILELQKNHQVPSNFWEKVKNIAVAIPFIEYDGQFQAEYIYTTDIPAKILTIIE